MGWGDTDISSASRLSDVLMNVQVNAISDNECDASSDGQDNYNGQINEYMLCAKANSKDSCQGDSGGPLVETVGGVDKLCGVVSWGIGCASPNFPGVYAKVSQAYSWIEGQVCNENDQYATEAGFDCANANFVASEPAPAPAPSPLGSLATIWYPQTSANSPSGGTGEGTSGGTSRG
eukprot:959342_1